MSKRRLKNKPHVDYTISGLTIDDMMNYNIKPEYQAVNDINESYKPNHAYRNLDKYNNIE